MVLQCSGCLALKGNFQTSFSFLLCLIDVHIVQAVCSPGSYLMLLPVQPIINNQPLLTTPFFREDKVRLLLVCGLAKQKGYCVTVGKPRIFLFGVESTSWKDEFPSVKEWFKVLLTLLLRRGWIKFYHSIVSAVFFFFCCMILLLATTILKASTAVFQQKQMKQKAESLPSHCK